jgi:hypothetical protein
MRGMTMRRVILVSCTADKHDEPLQAQYLYTKSTLFRKASAYARQHGDAWFIMSAKHALLRPTDVVEPYNTYLPKLPLVERKRIGERVVDTLCSIMGEDEFEVEIHAGKEYVKAIVPFLDLRGVRWSDPMNGLGIGQRLAEYKKLGY